MTITIPEETALLFKGVQEHYAAAVESADGSAKFKTDNWQRPDASTGFGGGGVTKILRNGGVFEQAGVNFSEVHGVLTSEMTERLTGRAGPEKFYATGISLVIHPLSPMIPTTHANLRYLEVGEKKWFGGGSDLTPYYFYAEDAKFFHESIKNVCDGLDKNLYPDMKKQCDEYFYLPHRKETRGIGGIFFDCLGKDDAEQLGTGLALVKALGAELSSFYLPIVDRRKSEKWGEAERNFQLIRRGRYVEFNLLYDRGTLFGLKTDGRTESILMSLPPNVRWEYEFEPLAGSREAELISVLRSPRAWDLEPG